MGAKAQAIGLSRNRETTKIHAFTDVIGNPYALMLTSLNVLLLDETTEESDVETLGALAQAIENFAGCE